MPLRAVIIDGETLSSHGNWHEDLRGLLRSLNRYQILVTDIEQAQKHCRLLEIPGVDCLVIADCEATLAWAGKWNMAVLGYQPAGTQYRITHHLPMVVEGFAEVDFQLLERVYQRYHGIPWRILETTRCLVREITMEDLDELYQIYQAPEMTQFQEGLYPDRWQEEEYTRNYIQHMYGFYGYGIWAVIERERSSLIGRAGLSNLEVEGQQELELGYAIGVPWQRQGYGLEVCQGILAYAHTELGAERVFCLIQKENVASLRLAEALGFVRDQSVQCKKGWMERYVVRL